jgi:hypothetical protein
MEVKENAISAEVKNFGIKTAIIALGIIVTVIVLAPDLGAVSDSINRALSKEKNKVLLMSFIQNPGSLYRAAAIDERDGKLDNAIMEMEAAIGLLEMHGADTKVVHRYYAKLSDLKAKLSIQDQAL